MDTSNTKLKNVKKIGHKKNNILKINEKMTKLDLDISELYRKYSQTKRERLSQEKNQKSIMNRIKYLEDEEKKMRVKCKLQQQKINALTKRLEEKKNEEKYRNIETDNYNKSFNKKITNFKYLQKDHHKKDSSNEQSLDSDPSKKKINIKNNIIIINNNKYDQNSNISEIVLNDKLHLINEKNINDELNNKDKYAENNQDNLDTNRNRTELEGSSLYESDNSEDDEDNSLPVYNYEIVKAEDYHEPAIIIQPNKRNSYNNNNFNNKKNVKNFQKNKSGINNNTKIKNPKSKIDNNIPNYKRNNSAVNKRFYKPKKNNPLKIEKPDNNKNNSFLIKKNITTIDINKEKDKNKNSKNAKINKKDDKKKINKRKEENREKANKSLEVRRKKKDKNAGENKNKKIKIIKRHLLFNKMSKNYSERDNNIGKGKNYTTKNRFNNGTNNITYDFVINDDKIYYNNNDKKRYNILDTDSNSLVNKDVNQNYIYLKNEEKMKKIILNNKK